MLFSSISPFLKMFSKTLKQKTKKKQEHWENLKICYYNLLPAISCTLPPSVCSSEQTVLKDPPSNCTLINKARQNFASHLV